MLSIVLAMIAIILFPLVVTVIQTNWPLFRIVGMIGGIVGVCALAIATGNFQLLAGLLWLYAIYDHFSPKRKALRDAKKKAVKELEER